MDNTSSIYLYVKLNWDANRFLPAGSKDCMNSASCDYRNMTARGGAQFQKGHKGAYGNAYHLLESLSREDYKKVVN